MQLLQLAQAVANPTGAEQGNPSAQPDTATDSASDSSSSSDDDSESVTADASGHEGRTSARRRHLAASQAQNLLKESDKDVIVLDEHVETEGLETVHMTTEWGQCVEQEEEGWPTHFPSRKPFIKPRVEEANDDWYQGEDCVDPSEITTTARLAILPAADGTLALKQDAAMPGASRGHTKYETHDLVCLWRTRRASMWRVGSSPFLRLSLSDVTRDRKSSLPKTSFGKRRSKTLFMSLVRMTPPLTSPTIPVSCEQWPPAPMAWEYPYA